MQHSVVNRNRRTGENRIVGSYRELTIERKDRSRIWGQAAISKIEYLNAGFEYLAGYSLEEARGKKPGPMLQGEGTDPETVREIRAHLDRQKPLYTEILNYHKNGTPYWVSLAIAPVFDENGRVNRFISVEADITRSKQQTVDFTRRLHAIERAMATMELRPDGSFLSANKLIRDFYSSKGLTIYFPVPNFSCSPRSGCSPLILAVAVLTLSTILLLSLFQCSPFWTLISSMPTFGESLPSGNQAETKAFQYLSIRVLSWIAFPQLMLWAGHIFPPLSGYWLSAFNSTH